MDTLHQISRISNKTAWLVILISVCINVLCIPCTASPESASPKPKTYDPRALQERYESWLKKHRRQYGSRDEWLLRFGIYQSNVEFIDYINSQNLSYNLSDNKYADLTNEEFKSMYLGLGPLKFANTKSTDPEDLSDVPPSMDWRKAGAVSPVQDQGNCGSCWAFSASAAVEGLHKIKTGKLIDLSVQQLVDCDVKNGNDGCNGGLMDTAFEYIEKYGLTTEKAYPYIGRDEICDKSKIKDKLVTISGYKALPARDEDSLQAAVARQPVSVAIDAGSIEFQLYSGGIFSGYCGTDLNHGVLAVGYGEEDGKKYWIVKNSWGEEWGEEGYVRMERDYVEKDGICGIAKQSSYPIMTSKC
ncbi:hypothetical protein Tsubulata_019510 [Turnera subulata]|uniref:Cysteine protease n=1 Tax=Turnera subulata TaxID=218843 RepID=A0A9Q0FV03_9ROSI|nr:hypothetical protein Tsubulata_019510 [Turnera subulata]